MASIKVIVFPHLDSISLCQLVRYTHIRVQILLFECRHHPGYAQLVLLEQKRRDENSGESQGKTSHSLIFKLDYVDQFWTVQKHVLFCRYGFSSLDLLENRLDHLDLVDFQYRELSLRSV